jgi:hypothetical protein
MCGLQISRFQCPCIAKTNFEVENSAYKRGEQNLQVEVSRLQSWTETADIHLYGPDGDSGMVREWQDDQAEKKANRRHVATVVTLCGVFGAIPAVIEIFKLFHWIP